MRFNGNKGSFRTISLLSKKKIYQKILTTHAGLCHAEVEQVFNIDSINRNRQSILNIPSYLIIKNCATCQKFDIDFKPIESLRFCLRLRNHKLLQRINILKDIGVPTMKLFDICKLRFLLNKSIPKFKHMTNIPSNKNINENIFSKLGGPPIDDQFHLNDKISARVYYETCLLYCKNKIFDLSNIDDKAMFHRNVGLLSISMLMETLKVLRIELGYNNEMIKRNFLVATASAENIRSLLNEFENTGICGISIIELLRKYSFMLFQDPGNIKELLKSFKRYKIPDEYVHKFFHIFTIDNETFIQRMKDIKRHPDLHLWDKHPRILKLIGLKGMAYDRAEYLRYSNRIKWARLHTVLLEQHNMDRYLQFGNTMTTTKKSLRYLFTNELGQSGVDAVRMFSRHQYWNTVGYVDIVDMLKYLKTKFTVSEICQNIHIVLYAKPIIEKLLTELKEQYSQSTEFSFTNGQYLALCLYMLEKDTHFTGDSVWSNGHNVKEKYMSKDQLATNKTNDSSTDDSDDIPS